MTEGRTEPEMETSRSTIADPAEIPLSGVEAVKSYIATLPNGPGVYRMLNRDGKVLYVGKA